MDGCKKWKLGKISNTAKLNTCQILLFCTPMR